MLLPVFIAVLLLPLIEIVIFILASNFLSFMDTVFIILVSGIIGFYNLSRAKVGALRAIELILEPQINNKNQMFKSLLYCISGLLLIIPGLISDSIGLTIMLYAILGLRTNIHDIEQPNNKGTTIEGEYNKEEH
tara:strand:- start:194 stop:595 length:402 start_codon:yes stop_codon:yes gene_type:complete